jgi:predicted RNase H-like nuclease (RuvC/YqgF family)
VNENSDQPSIETRLERIEKEMKGLRKFVTTLETGHEARARDWNRKISALAHDIEELQTAYRRTKKKVKKLSR